MILPPAGITSESCSYQPMRYFLVGWLYFITMAEDKKSFLLYADEYHTVKKLSDEQAGRLFKHILKYVNDENPITDDVIVDLVFEHIKQQLKRDLRKYESIKEKRSQAGKISADKKQQVLTSVELAKQSQQVLTSVPVNVTGNGNVTVTDTVNDTVNEEINKRIVSFDSFWDKYEKDEDRIQCEVIWMQLSNEEREECIKIIPAYVESTPDKAFRKSPKSYLKNKSWKNEIITKNTSKVAPVLTYDEILKISERNPDIWKQYKAEKREGERKAVFKLIT
jgi:hypothetical protein